MDMYMFALTTEDTSSIAMEAFKIEASKRYGMI
jgi:hypothetical protein